MKAIKTTFLLAFLLCIGIALVNTVVTSERIETGILRLHIRANGNSEEEQAIKLQVRDCILQKAGELFVGCRSKEESMAVVAENLPYLKQIADSKLAECGADYTATVFLDRQWFPTKSYDGISLPAGTYSALVIELGSGKGDNWWCMLYPTLCPFGQTVRQTEESKEELQILVGESAYQMLQEEKPSVRFYVVEIWDRLKSMIVS